jgi:hypothetical protein
MTLRTLLRKQLKDAWRNTIEEDYHRQRINSERSLQASLWSKLNIILPPKTRRLFIEPPLKAIVTYPDGSERCEIRYPDLVVCNTRNVIGIIELKYKPRAAPNWQNDFEKFCWILDNQKQIVVQNVRYRGLEVDGQLYPLADDVLFVWAGVHAEWNGRLADHIDRRLSNHFLELHAVTRDGEHPELIDGKPDKATKEKLSRFKPILVNS